ncbi:pyrroline-5-carboxylate reductase [Pseudalkalibacillus salsuginis]|uniref:pyrroline-5-carboxylate reductase n=1 Tax=Pseudalkalibacillus salsuginis TaxID=2910972 RepID=UPI001F2FAAA3|nr:pyrroline-5-carboxylate reductase [Pseudalkalibacillus salsuginis]MCF6410996.1 pyrroline-5-carboxylate reductase [Pseudalkalibacillus salsuginis]
MTKQRVAFLGAGNMAEAMISGIVESGKFSPEQIIATNRNNQERLNTIKEKYGIEAVTKDQLDFSNITVFILAMKPKDVESALSDLKDHLKPEQLLISVLAGISTTYIEENLNERQQVIRVMPNTSSMLGESATAICPGQHVSMDQVLLTKELMNCIGEAYTIDESQMDIFTGIAGSGPAYFYNLMEHMEQAGYEGGMDRELARKIGAQTIRGAAQMMLEQEETPAQLRKKVTSPNGTTAAGLEALAKNGGGKAIAEAVKGAASRSKELREELEKVFAEQK